MFGISTSHRIHVLHKDMVIDMCPRRPSMCLCLCEDVVGYLYLLKLTYVLGISFVWCTQFLGNV